jgi:hypothetical protein
MEKYGVPYASQNPQIKNKIAETIISKDWKSKQRSIMMDRYGVTSAMKNPELARKQRESSFKAVACDGTKLDSSWEKIFYDFLIHNGIEFEYNTTTIPYEYEGVQHTLYVDFKIGDYLFEVKGDHLLQGVSFPNVVPISKKIELYRKHHIILVCGSNVNDIFGKPNSTVSNGLKYLDKCPEPLIGVDIKLFDNPSFPFRGDRPPCFYSVKVDGQMSSLEAFYNPSIRWKMILNRIQYSGGFIDAKQVLTAMNVTRTCKQPSWFSESLASKLIQAYCTSDVIVDPFAGWGTRHDAAVKLNKQYIGVDLNPELVSWHKDHNRSIQLGDASEFTYDGDCSVFICPPYSDPATGRCFEDYNFFGFDSIAKQKSQGDWLKIVMKNVPNAREYVMVCKVLDDDISQFVCDTISNKSHLGTNNEHIVVISNSDAKRILNLC